MLFCHESNKSHSVTENLRLYLELAESTKTLKPEKLKKPTDSSTEIQQAHLSDLHDMIHEVNSYIIQLQLIMPQLAAEESRFPLSHN